MERTCTQCQKGYEMSPDERSFLNKLMFTFGKEHIRLPEPVMCPDCRTQIRTAHRNEQYLYKTRSAFSGKDIIGLYSPESASGKKFTVYGQDEWKSDGWDPLSYGRDFAFDRPFFEQFQDLQLAVPRVALNMVANENSGFTTGTGYCKNCYLINSSEYSEDCYYGKLFQKCKSSVDCCYLYGSELCYECFSVFASYNCRYVWFSQNCQDCIFSSNLQACKNCCLCTNMTHKEYCLMNKQLSKEEYHKQVKDIFGSHESVEAALTMLRELNLKRIHKYANTVNSEHCTGDYIENSQNCQDCYDVNESQDCRHVQVGVNVKDIYHSSNMYLKPELCYETLGTIEAHTVAFCLYVFHSQRMLYCESCHNCSDCFGCSGLTRKKYCILNKQYTKEEYEALVPRIIEKMRTTPLRLPDGSSPLRPGGATEGQAAGQEWGLFFPPSLSPFGYNETLASEYFPMTREDALRAGFFWKEKDVRDYMPQTVPFPVSIADTKDTIVQEIFCCTDCGKNYRIIPQELAFYRQNGLDIPRSCPECRQKTRMSLRNPRVLYSRSCDKCRKDIRTTFQPSRPETVYCEKCYLEAVY